MNLKHSVQFLSVLVLTDLGQSCVISLCGLLWWCCTLLVSHKVYMSLTYVFAHIARICLCFVTNFTLISYARTEQARRLLEVIFTRNILHWETFNPYFRWSDFWESLKSSLGKVCFFFIWEKFGTLL